MAKKRKKKFLKKARASMEKRGTVGSFTEWCKRNGFPSGVTAGCIAKGLRAKSAAIRKKAAFAKASRTIARRRKKKK